LFASDLNYLQDYYQVINFGDPSALEGAEQTSPFDSSAALVG